LSPLAASFAASGPAQNRGVSPMSSRLNLGELVVSLALIAIGIFVLVNGSQYDLGTVGKMGPGYLPRILGVALIVAGFVAAPMFARLERPNDAIPFRPLAMVGAGILAWALTVERLGLAPASIALVVLASLADKKIRPLTTILLAIGLAAFGVFVFVDLLGMSLRSFPWN
jgi:hypothetical protein